jgi:hypothetical protein
MAGARLLGERKEFAMNASYAIERVRDVRPSNELARMYESGARRTGLGARAVSTGFGAPASTGLGRLVVGVFAGVLGIRRTR